jgi:DNA repair exonuclease SbcCD ATPase subunit
MTDRELKTFLETILPVDGLDESYKKASKAVSDHQLMIDKLDRELELKDWQMVENKRLLKEALDSRINYTKDIDAKNALIESQIKAKRLARGVALVMANKGTLEKDIANLKSEIAAVGDSDVSLANYKLTDVQNAIMQLNRQIEFPETDCSKCGQKVVEKDELISRLSTRLEEYREIKEKREEHLRFVVENNTRKTGLKTKLKELSDKLIEAKRAADAVERLDAEIRLLEGQKAPAGVNPHQAAVTRHRDALKATIADQKRFQTELTEATAKLELLKAVQLTYSSKGLRYHMLEKVAPTLTSNTNKYLNILTDGAITAVWSTVSKMSNGEYKEKFSIEAKMEGRNKFGLLSGGEKRKVRLACFFALQDLIASQAAKPIELWVGDEIDHALDEAGLERLMVVLNQKLAQKKTILVISHNDLKGWIPQSIRVTRKDGISTVLQDF